MPRAAGGHVEAVEWVGRDPERAVALDVGHARVAAQSARRAAPEGTVAASTPVVVKTLGLGAEAPELGGQRRPASACVRAPTSTRTGPSELAIARELARADGGRALAGSGSGSGTTPSRPRARCGRSASRSAPSSLTSLWRPARSAAQSGGAQRKVASTALTHADDGRGPALAAAFAACCPRSASARSTCRPSGSASPLGVPGLGRRDQHAG